MSCTLTCTFSSALVNALHLPLCVCGSAAIRMTQTANAIERVRIPLPRDSAVSATTIVTLLQCQYLEKLRVASHVELIPTELTLRS
jgi:hypothetical protein